MTKEQEAQQAQTIAEIRARHTVPDIDHGRGGPVANPDCVALLEIVDSQAQKIAEQAKEIERLKDLVRKISGAEPDAYKRQTNPHNAYEVIP